MKASMRMKNATVVSMYRMSGIVFGSACEEVSDEKAAGSDVAHRKRLLAGAKIE